jgi:hypothetical protein
MCGFWPEDLSIQTLGGSLGIYTAGTPAAIRGLSAPGDTYLMPCIYSYPVAHKPKLEFHYLLQLAHEIEFGSKTFSGKTSQSLQRSLVMVTPLLYYYHPGSAYGTREDSVQLFSSSLQYQAYAHIKTCNNDKDTQLPRALAILSCSFWRSSLRKGGGQTDSCSSCSADMISTTIRILWTSPSTDSQWEVCIFLDLGAHTTWRMQAHHVDFAAPRCS